LKFVPAVALVALMAGAGAIGFMASRQRERPDGRSPVAQAPASPRVIAEPRIDQFGDPLPAGAIARLGTIRFNHGERLNALHFAPDGKTIISEGNGSFCVWDAANGKEVRRFSMGKPRWDVQTVLTPDGKTLISLSQDGPGDTLRAWDLATGNESRSALL
jgi:hypothetical protein